MRIGSPYDTAFTGSHLHNQDGSSLSATTSFRSDSLQRLLLFSLLATLASAFGQTFFIGLFGGAWREEFGLGNAQLGMLYSGATLVSGMTILYVGRRIDDVRLHRYTAATIVAFAAGAVLIAVAPNIGVLLLGIVLLRLCGQGLMGHIAMTTVARYFHVRRGRALSIAQLGFPLGEAMFPLLVVAALDVVPWRALWWACAASLLFVLLPVQWRLSSGAAAPQEQAEVGSIHASRRHVLRDRRFYLILPVLVTTPFIATGLFFHQTVVAEAMGWPLTLLASGFVVYAITQVGSAVLTGWWIDRVSARRLMRFYLFPLALGCLALRWSDHPSIAFVYLGLLGISAGASATLSGALWAELYGTRHLGAIRAMQHAFMVLSTAAAPVLLGLALDAGLGVRDLAALLGAYALVVGPLLGGAVLRPGAVGRTGTAP